MSDPITARALYEVTMGLIGGAGLFFLKGIRDELKDLKGQLRQKVDKDDCRDHRDSCRIAQQ